jgi:hypothetical protein
MTQNIIKYVETNLRYGRQDINKNRNNTKNYFEISYSVHFNQLIFFYETNDILTHYILYYSLLPIKHVSAPLCHIQRVLKLAKVTLHSQYL